MVSFDELIEPAIKRPHVPATRRWWLLTVLMGGALAVLGGRSFELQIIRGAALRSTAESNRVVSELVPAPRGIIYDRHRLPLVGNLASTAVVVNPTRLPPENEEGPLIEQLPRLLGISPDEVQHAILTARQSSRVTRLAAGLPHDAVLAVQQALPSLPGIELSSALYRDYPESDVAAHLVGYANAVTAEELNLRPSLGSVDSTGKSGLESQYDDALRGQHGARYFEADASGQVRKPIRERAPIAGASVITTIDLDFQRYIMDQLRARAAASVETAGQQAAVVALDPRSGAIRALVSYPSFDPNLFSAGNRRRSPASTIADPLQPLFNRALSGTYPPGSVIKPFLATAALDAGIITRHTIIDSSGGLTVGPWFFPDWKVNGHGLTTVTKAIAESVNTFFYAITGGTETQVGLGIEPATAYLARLGFGDTTGIDLPSEAKGLLPTPAWKEATKGERWYIGDTFHFAIGQGDLQVTPLQVASATSTLANGGVWHRPFIVDRIEPVSSATETTKPVSRPLELAPQAVATARAGMREAITSPTGSGRALATLALPVAGKTGTAQIGGSESTHAWFTSFGPYDAPELVVTVLLERGGEGDKDAAPVAQAIWRWWFENQTH